MEIHLWNIRDWAAGQAQERRRPAVRRRPRHGDHAASRSSTAVEAVQAGRAEPGLLVMLTPAGERLTQPVVQDLATPQAAAAAVRPVRGLRRAHPAGAAAARDLDRRLRLQRRRGAGDGGDRHGDPLRARACWATRRAWRRNRTARPGRLEYPQYTRPRVFRGMEVPEVLLSGNHQAVARWRREQSEARSRPRASTNARTERRRRAMKKEGGEP